MVGGGTWGVRTQRRQRRAIASVVASALLVALVDEAASASTAPAPVHGPLSADLVALDAGCAASDEPEDLEAVLLHLPGVVSYDSARFVELGEGRRLWLMRDAFMDPWGDSTTYLDPGVTYVNNLAVLQEGRCFRVVTRGTVFEPSEFESGELSTASRLQFYWPLGGELIGDKLVVYWSQMITERPAPPVTEGYPCRPTAVWYATYDPVTLERLTMWPAPNSGVFPQYGYSVNTSGDWAYLFGNSDLYSFPLEGGFFADHHSVSDMFLARMPAGAIGAVPEYFDGSGWSNSATDAVPISSRYHFGNQMHPVLVKGRWLAVTKKDELLGHDLVIDVADQPWGPWVTVYDEPVEPPLDQPGQVVYHPVIMPWQNHDGTMRIMMSMNNVSWETAAQNPSMYDPYVLTIDVSDIPELAALFGPP
jgi:hypothetical protein